MKIHSYLVYKGIYWFEKGFLLRIIWVVLSFGDTKLTADFDLIIKSFYCSQITCGVFLIVRVCYAKRINVYCKTFFSWLRHTISTAQMKHINLSFAACGFLGIYHLGAAAAFHRHGKKLLRDVKAFAGASAGSLAAAVLLAVPENIEVN